MTPRKKTLPATEWLRAFANGKDAEWDGDLDAPGSFLARVLVRLLTTRQELLESFRDSRYPQENAAIPFSAKDVRNHVRNYERQIVRLRQMTGTLFFLKLDRDQKTFALCSDATAAGLLAGLDFSREDSLVWMPFVRRGAIARQSQRRKAKARASFFSESVHPTIRAEFERRRKAKPSKPRAEILKEMAATGKYAQLRQLQNICKGMK